MSADAVVIAAFDFDGTLTRRDNVVPFLRRVRGLPKLVWGALRRWRRLVPALARRERDTVKAVMSEAAFAGIHESVLDRHGSEMAASIVGNHLRADVMTRLGWHHAQGHRVVIVSASYEAYLRHVARLLELDAAIGTRLEVGADGRCTGRLLGPNCRAAEKWTRLLAWLESEGLSRSDVTLWAYGDSAGDRQLLDGADHPVWAKQPIASVAASS